MSRTSELIRRLRAAGLSQTEIGLKTRISQSRLSRWENGRAAAAADDVLKLADLHAAVCGADVPPAAAAADQGVQAHCVTSKAGLPA